MKTESSSKIKPKSAPKTSLKQKTKTQKSRSKANKTQKKPQPKRAKNFKSAKEEKRPEQSLFYRHHPFLKLIEFHMWEFLLTVSKSAAIQVVKGCVRISRETLSKLLTPARIKKCRKYLSMRVLTMPPDDKVIAWDYIKHGPLPSEIRLDYTNLPEEFFKVPVPAKVREVIRSMLTMRYPPADIVFALKEAFPGLSFTIEDVLRFRYFFWDIGDLMDSADGQAAFRNKLVQIRSDIITGKNLERHLQVISQRKKTLELKILLASIDIKNGDNKKISNQKLRWVETPYLRSDNRQEYSPWFEIGSTDPDVSPLASFDIISNILAGVVNPTDLALHIGIVPPKFRNIEKYLRTFLPIISIKLGHMILSNDDKRAAFYLANVALKYAEYLQKLGIPAVDSTGSDFMDQINLKYNKSKHNGKKDDNVAQS